LPRNFTEKHGIKRHTHNSLKKGSNGGVAVGLPHRNSSVLKQAHINEWKVKRKNKKKAWGEHQRIDIRRSMRKGGLRGNNSR
jgi:hypothetical protein